MADEIDVERPEGLDPVEVPDPDLVEVSEYDKDGAKVKMVPLEALHGAREESKRLKETLGRIEPYMDDFEQFLQEKNKPKAPPVPQRPVRQELSDEEVEELAATAQMLGYVNPETGQPDLHRTQRVLQVLDRRAGRIADSRMQPVAQNVAADRARTNRQNAYERIFDDGRPVAEQQYIDQAFDSLPPEYAADPLVASTTHLLAAGLEYLEKRKAAAGGGRRTPPLQDGSRPVRFRQREPVFYEPQRGRNEESDDDMSDFSIAAARARGKTPEQWNKQRAKATKRANSDVLDDGF